MENRLLTRERMDRMIDAADDGGRKGPGRSAAEGAVLDQALAPGPGRVFRTWVRQCQAQAGGDFQLKYDYHNSKDPAQGRHGPGPQPSCCPAEPRPADGGLAQEELQGCCLSKPGQGPAGGQPQASRLA